MNNFFKVSHKSNKSKARLGEIITSHGVIKTPAFAPCATKGTLKTLLPSLIKEIGIQTAFVNTYHLATHPGVDIIEKAGGIHEFSRLNLPLMSDSGGFQVFSLARNNKVRHHPAKREMSSLSSVIRKADIRGEEEPLLVKISEDGVKFRSTYNGQLIEFTPEKSMEFQRKIGADINMAFDECTYYPATHEYAEKAMKRTHRWLERCIKEFKKFKGLKSLKENSFKPFKTFKPSNLQTQYLYGVIQGGTFEDLRKKSAEFVVSQNTPGVAIGGVSVGETKKEMREQVKWVSDYLPKDRPVHLLGIGQIDDIIDLVKYGIDSFDCVEPTRLARMGVIYKIFNFPCLAGRQEFSIFNETLKNKIFKQENLDITRTIYRNNLEKIDVNCNCYVCHNFTKSYLHHLFKQKEILGYTLATYHNLWVMEKLFDRIREAIGNDLI